MSTYQCPECGTAGTCRACKSYESGMRAARTRVRKVRDGYRETVKVANAKRVPVVRGTRTARTAEKVVRKHVRAEHLTRIILSDDAPGIAADVAYRGHVSADMRDMSPRGIRSGNIVPPADVRVTRGDTAVFTMDAETGERGARTRVGRGRVRMDREVSPGAVHMVRTVGTPDGGRPQVVKGVKVGAVVLPYAPHVDASPVREESTRPALSRAKSRRLRKASQRAFAVRLVTGPEVREPAVIARQITGDDGTTRDVFMPGMTAPEVIRGVQHAPDSFNATVKGSAMHMPELETFTCRVCGLEWPEVRNAGGDVCMDDAGMDGPTLKTDDVPVIDDWRDVMMHGVKVGTVGRGVDMHAGEFVAFAGIGLDARYLGWFPNDRVAGDAVAKAHRANS